MIPLPIKFFLNEQQRTCVLVVDLSIVQLNEEQLTYNVKTLLEKIRIAAERSFVLLNCIVSWDFKKIIEGKMSPAEMVLKLKAFIEMSRGEKEEPEKKEEAFISPVKEVSMSFSLRKRKTARRSATSFRSGSEKGSTSSRKIEHLLKKARKRASDISTVNFSSKSKEELFCCLEKITAFLDSYLQRHYPQLMRATSEIAVAMEQTTSLLGHLRSRVQLLQPEEAFSFKEAYSLAPLSKKHLREFSESEIVEEAGPKKRYLSSKEGQQLLQSLQTSASSSFWKIHKPWKEQLYQANLAEQRVQSFSGMFLTSIKEVSQETGIEKMDLEGGSSLSVQTQEHMISRPVSLLETENEDVFESISPSVGMIVGSDDEADMEVTEPLCPMMEAIQPRAVQEKKSVNDYDDAQLSTLDSVKDVLVVETMKSEISIEPVDTESMFISCFLPSVIHISKRIFVLKQVWVENLLKYIERERESIAVLVASSRIETISSVSFSTAKELQIYSLQTLLMHLRGLIKLSTELSKITQRKFQDSCQNLFIKIHQKIKKIESITMTANLSVFTRNAPAFREEDPDFPDQVHCFIGLIFPKAQEDMVYVSSRVGMQGLLDLQAFLEKIKIAAARSSYKCLKYIPEIEHFEVKNNRRELIKLLYASVLRNQYFYNKIYKGKDKKLVEEAVKKVLDFLNNLYESISEKSSQEGASEHVQDLRAFTIDPTTPPQGIIIVRPLPWVSLERRSQGKNSSLWIKKKVFEQQQTVRDQLDSLYAYVKTLISQYTDLRNRKRLILQSQYEGYEGIDDSKKVVKASEVIKVLRQITNENKYKFKKYFANEYWVKETYTGLGVYGIQGMYERILSRLEECLIFLAKWEEELVDTEMLEDSDNEEETASLGPIKTLSKKLAPKDFTFPKLAYKESKNTCSIDLYRALPSSNIFINFLEKIKKAKDSCKCVCLVPIEGLEKSMSSPQDIVRALFLITCQFTCFYYRQKQQKGYESFISEEMVSSLRQILQELDRKYCHVLELPYEESSDSYHKDLQAIANKYEIAAVFASGTPIVIFSYHVAHINFSKNIIQIKKNNSTHVNISNLLVKFETSLMISCVYILRVIRNESINLLTVRTTDSSFSIMGAPGCMSVEMNREQFLKQLQILLNQTEEKFKGHAAFDLYKDRDMYGRIAESLQITSLWLDAAVNKRALPDVRSLPARLNPAMVYYLSMAKHSRGYFTVEIGEMCYQITENARTLCSKAVSLMLKLNNLMKKGLDSTSRFRCGDNEITDLRIIIPLWYRCIEQMSLQLQKIYLTVSTNERKVVEATNLQNAIQLYEKGLISLKAGYEELVPGSDIPQCHELSPELQSFLCLSTAQKEELQTQIESLKEML